MSTTVVLITGANTGIGYETVKALLQSREEKKYHILLGARSGEKGSEAVKKLKEEISSTRSEIEAVLIDIDGDESIERLVKEVEGKVGRVDVLINNAGVELDATGPKRGLTTRQIFTQTFNTNVAGTHIFTTHFIPLLLKSSSPRLIFLTSGLASFSFTNNTEFIMNKAPPSGWPKPEQRELPSYKSSKVGVNMIMREWERILRNDGVKVWAINPGFLVTGLGGDADVMKKMGAGEARTGGELVASVVEGERDEDRGKMVQEDGILDW